MDRGFPLSLNPEALPSPCFVVDEESLGKNCRVLDDVQKATGCRILLALKGFAMWSAFPVIRETLHGVCASSPYEARLGREEFGREVHTFAPAYSDADIEALLLITDHLVFNSFNQWDLHRKRVEESGRPIRCGLRVNPEHSEGQVAIYDPCSPGSRLGIRRIDFEDKSLDGISGLHFHTLCEQNADALQRTLGVFEEKFAEFLPGLEWVNFGGGHHITRADYDIALLTDTISGFRKRHPHLRVYLEPGEAVALNTGVLVATVMDIVRNDMDIAILDTSASAHMPDVLEMPYRPEILGAGKPGERPHTYRLGGLTCLAGDVIGEYSFEKPLRPGQRLVFLDMAHYSMVKTTMFNGIHHPSIAIRRKDGTIDVVRTFGYEDYKGRLS